MLDTGLLTMLLKTMKFLRCKIVNKVKI